jgi:hypothetical protein
LATCEYRLEHSCLLDGQASIEFVFGARSLEAQFERVRRLRLRYGQQDDLTTDPQYFIATNILKGRSPGAALIRVGGNLEGCVLFYEYRHFSIGVGVARLGNFVGQGLVVGPENLQMQLVDFTTRALLQSRRVHSVTIAMKAPLEDCVQHIGRETETARFSSRVIQYSLPLTETYPEMLASFGPRTRRSIAGKRRQLEKSLPVVFEPELNPAAGLEAMLSLQQRSLPRRKSAYFLARYRLQREHLTFFSMGIRTPSGWLSILSGWRLNRVTYVDLQMNDQNMKKESLSAVMRAYLLEHEISIKQQRIEFVGGSSPLLGRYCRPVETCTDIFVSRPGLRSSLFLRLLPPAKLRSILERVGPSLGEMEQAAEKPLAG